MTMSMVTLVSLGTWWQVSNEVGVDVEVEAVRSEMDELERWSPRPLISVEEDRKNPSIELENRNYRHLLLLDLLQNHPNPRHQEIDRESPPDP